MEDPKQAYARLEQTEAFKEFNEKHPKAFLSSFALMSSLQELESKPWHINFYVPENKKMTSFVMSNPVEVSHEQDILKKGEIKELKLDDVKADFNFIFEKAKAAYEENKTEGAQTVVIMLQKNDHANWVITFVTATMKMLSITFDALKGEIMDVKKSNFSYKVEKKS